MESIILMFVNRRSSVHFSPRRPAITTVFLSTSRKTPEQRPCLSICFIINCSVVINAPLKVIKPAVAQ